MPEPVNTWRARWKTIFLAVAQTLWPATSRPARNTAKKSFFAVLRAGRDVAGHSVCATAKKMVFHLARQVLTGSGIGQIEPVFVDQHGLLLHPVSPGFLADFFPE